jgi:hypothetical protein
MIHEGEIRFNLDQQDFRDLVHGHEVLKFANDREGHQHKVRFILSDISFKIMLSEINDAMRR